MDKFDFEQKWENEKTVFMFMFASELITKPFKTDDCWLILHDDIGVV